ncbi:putative sulfate transporter 3.3 [Ananas comosus]|uniref:Putative sulfate transporter 3.3 n=1 Tax=Ananas comosus TaxID=4615 RepID=A0A199V994_ANACO|nr:putative sulfate transporter 3.3 [Ananas comosus]
MAGAAIIVSLQQLKSLLGIVHFTNQMGLVPVMSSIFHRTNELEFDFVWLDFDAVVLADSVDGDLLSGVPPAG